MKLSIPLRFVIAVISSVVYIVSVRADESDRVRRLPGQPRGGPAFAQYMGYVTIDSARGKAFYYALVEAQENAETRPLVLWLNGGPGCSSLGSGFFLENGPWRLRGPYSNRFLRNPYSWNLAANVLYLESPTGVGFSYSNTTADYNNNSDRQTASDNLRFLLAFLLKFPRYAGRPLFLSGESYAGYYVPMLANQILTQGGIHSGLNLKGVLIGNGVSDVSFDALSTFTALHDRFFLTDETYATLLQACNASASFLFTAACEDVMTSAYRSVGQLDLYNVYATSCSYVGPSGASRRSYLKANSISPKAVPSPPPPNGTAAPPTVPPPFSITSPACGEIWVHRYLNSKRVRQALHANVRGGEWMTCSPYYYRTTTQTVLPLLQKFSFLGLRVWLYSGDTDTVVPFVGTHRAIASLHLPLLSAHKLWYYYDQVGGVVTRYNNLTQLTVRGAGHFVPGDEPERALFMLKRFLVGGKLPTNRFALDSQVYL